MTYKVLIVDYYDFFSRRVYDILNPDNGLTVIDEAKAIMAKPPIAILIFSSLIHQTVKSILEALNAIVLDLLSTKLNEIASNISDAVMLLLEYVIELVSGAKRLLEKSIKHVSYNEPLTLIAFKKTPNSISISADSHHSNARSIYKNKRTLAGKCLSNRATNPLTKIWIENKDTCVIYAMQQAVSEAGISELSSPIAFYSKAIMKEVNYG